MQDFVLNFSFLKHRQTEKNMKPLPYFTIVDRYFMKKFLFVATSLVLIGTSLFLLFDTFSKNDELSLLFQGSKIHAVVTMLKFYTLRMMNLLLYIQSALITLATAITFFMMEKDNNKDVRGGEIIPMLTSGFSRKRVAMPFFIVGCIFIFFMCFAEESFYIFCRDWPGANSNSLIGKIETQTMDMQNDISTGLKIYGTDLDLQTNSFSNPKIGVPKERTLGQLDELLASKALWLPECDDHPAGFMLEGVLDLDKKNWLTRAANTPVLLPHLGNVEIPIFYTPETAPWVSPGNVFIVSMLVPEDLTREKMMFLPESLPSLYKKINNKRQLGPKYRERISFHSRLLRPFLECTLLFLIIPVILTVKLSYPKLRYKIAIFAIITTLMGMNVGLAQIGRLLVIQDGISAALGAWIPLLIVTPVCAILFNELYT